MHHIVLVLLSPLVVRGSSVDHFDICGTRMQDTVAESSVCDVDACLHQNT